MHFIVLNEIFLWAKGDRNLYMILAKDVFIILKDQRLNESNSQGTRDCGIPYV